MTLDLTTLDWKLTGVRPYVWSWANSMETGAQLRADIAAMPAKVPGSVQQSLLNAGIIEDWHYGLKSRDCEWVEHRHWVFETTIPARSLPGNERLFLCADGLDYSGWIMWDGVQIAAFKGVLVPHVFELPPTEVDKDHRLSIVFDTPPEEQGQVGFTSQGHFFKPRYNFSWDWCPRFVPIGIWDNLRIETGSRRSVDLARVDTYLGEDNATGLVQVDFNFRPELAGYDDDPEVWVELCDGGRLLTRTKAVLEPGSNHIELPAVAIKPWWPNGAGEARLYSLSMGVGVRGRKIWEQDVQVGFKRVEWQQCEGAPASAEPWICVINGQPLFLQGANWTPVHVNYHDTTREDYARIIDRYVEMGANMLRVWGGAFLEKQDFYELCDVAGILVWQEFPLSSSGVDNWPPTDPKVIFQLEEIAISYVRRRRRHVSLILWCGGNELQGHLDGSPIGIGKPVDYSHPCIAMLQSVVEREDAQRRFLPTSASGPRFMAAAEDFGKGLHHDVHGPWGMATEETMDQWRAYWENDDSLFRSETGAPGASSLAMIQQYAAGEPAWPLLTPLWLHTSSWWTQVDRFGPILDGLEPEEALKQYVELTQAQQAEALAIAASASKSRFPRCGGFLIWMGHDCFPCLSNTAVIDFEGEFKPAGLALKEVFLGP